MSKEMILVQRLKILRVEWFCEEDKDRFFVRQCGSVTLVADVADANISLAEHDEKGKGSGLAGNDDLIAMAIYGRSGLEH